jgi:hypothetical protein
MLMAGLPVDAFSQHHASALHWACFHGNAELVRLMVARGAAIENTDNEYGSTPLNWAMHGSKNGWRPQEGDYPATVETLLDLGARLPERADGAEAAMAVLRSHGWKG